MIGKSGIIWVLLATAGFASAQSATPTPAVWTATDVSPKSKQGTREQQSTSADRLRALREGRSPGDVSLIRDSKGVRATYSPTLTEEDVRAVSISPDDLTTWEKFLQSPKTGIIRLQSSDVCPPNDMVVKASAGCRE